MKPLATATVVVVTVAATAAIVWGVAAVAPASLLDAISKLGPVTTGLVAIFALIVGISTIGQKQRADAEVAEAERRDQWWKRAQWAIDRLFEAPEDRQVVAWRILRTLAESNLAGPEELAVFEAVGADELTRLSQAGAQSVGERGLRDTGEKGGDDMTDRTEAPAPLIPTRTEVEAAKLKIVVDRRLGQKTPEWVLRVADGLPPVAPAS